MQTTDFIDLLPSAAVQDLQDTLSQKRFAHSVRVLGVCETIFHAWNLDGDPADMAWTGLFHDCAKEFRQEEYQEWLQANGCPYGEDLLDEPKLVHGAVGAKVVKHKYGVENPDVWQAIAYHSTGHPDLNPLGWIVYMADFLEPARTFVEKREWIIEEACRDPLTGLRLVCDVRFATTNRKKREHHPTSVQFREYIFGIDELEIS